MNIAVALLSVLITVGIITGYIFINKLCKRYLGAEIIEIFLILGIGAFVLMGFIGAVYMVYLGLMGQINFG